MISSIPFQLWILPVTGPSSAAVASSASVLIQFGSQQRNTFCLCKRDDSVYRFPHRLDGHLTKQFSPSGIELDAVRSQSLTTTRLIESSVVYERERETVLTWSTPVHLPLTPVDGRNRLLGKMASWRRLPSILWLLYVFVSGCYGNGSSLSGIGGVIGGGAGGDTFFPDWGVGGGRAAQPTCLDIPRNLSLCHGIRYSKMRLPNLLDHDSMAEVIQQAASWVPLLNVRCHADTQLFLCSLFRYFVLFSFVCLFILLRCSNKCLALLYNNSPVCLDRPIYPCRGLCERVRQGCEGRMKTYGYPWPDMLRCDKFPLDNDMCIGPLSTGSSSEGKKH